MYIFDLDGTIALNAHRQHFLPKEGKKDWEAWNKACVDDTPNWPVVNVMTALAEAGHTIYIITGRSVNVHNETVLWLANNDVPFDLLVMRPDQDHRDDTVIKLEMLKALEKQFDNDVVQAIFEDRQKVVDMWRKEGYTCFQVAPGDF